MTSFKRFLALCLVDFSARVSYNMARTPVLPLFAAALGAGPETVGLVVGASTITGIFLKAPAGALSDIFGRARTLLFGAFIFAFTPFIYLLASSAWTLIAIRLFHGLATAIYGPVAMATVAIVAGTRKGELLSWFSIIKIATNSLGGLLGGTVLYLLGKDNPSITHFHIAYIFCGGFGLSALFLASILLPGIGKIEEDKSQETARTIRSVYKKTLSGLKEVARDFQVILTSGTEGMQNLTMGVLHAFLPIYAVKEADLNVLEAGLLWSILTGASVVSKPLMGRISDRYGRKWIIVSGMVLCAIPFAVIPLFKNFFTLAGICILFGLGEAFVTSSTAALVAELCKEKSLGAAMGVFGTIADTGQALGPIVVGLLLTMLSYFASFIILGIVLLLWTFVFVLSVHETEDQPS